MTIDDYKATIEALHDRIVELEETNAELKAEILELRMEEAEESEPYNYAQEIIDSEPIEKIEEKVQWLNEVSEYLEVFLGYHRVVDDEEEQ